MDVRFDRAELMIRVDLARDRYRVVARALAGGAERPRWHFAAEQPFSLALGGGYRQEYVHRSVLRDERDSGAWAGGVRFTRTPPVDAQLPVEVRVGVDYFGPGFRSLSDPDAWTHSMFSPPGGSRCRFRSLDDRWLAQARKLPRRELGDITGTASVGGSDERVNADARSPAGEVLPMRVRIGEVEGRFAGKYRDIVHVSVTALY